MHHRAEIEKALGLKTDSARLVREYNPPVSPPPSPPSRGPRLTFARALLAGLATFLALGTAAQAHLSATSP